MHNYFNVLKAVICECKNWPNVVLSKIFDLRLYKIRLRNGVSLFIGSKIGKADLSMFAEIWHYKFYNPAGFEIKESDTAFDIGANNGFYSAYLAQKASRGMVYAFEPVPYLAEKIKKTADLNGFKNLKVENLAVGKSESSCSFYISKDHNGCHSIFKRSGSSEKITVSTVNLEKYCQINGIQQINFIKLDCEGSEYDIINDSSVEFFRKNVDRISMEYHDNITNHTHEEIIKTLSAAGFTTQVVNGFIYAKNGNK